MLKKNSELEQSIPIVWRRSIVEIVNDLRKRELLSRNIDGGSYTVDQENAERIYRNIDAYGEELDALNDDVWRFSVCRWMMDYWYVLIDLVTVDEGVSDLVLIINVYESDGSLRFDIQSVHVP